MISQTQRLFSPMAISKHRNIRALSLIVITFSYLLVGAAVFNALESKQEKLSKSQLESRIIQILFKNRNRNQTDIFNDQMLENVTSSVYKIKQYRAQYSKRWKYLGSLYFVTIVLTLVGYGSSTPKTLGGRIFCIIYSMVGIPLALIMFQSVGERLNVLIIRIFGRFKQKLNCRKTDLSDIELIMINSTLCMIVVLLCSIVFSRQEQWTYFEAIYYCLITLFTIGFGDYEPMKTRMGIYYFLFCVSFILTVLIIMASSMNLLVLRLVSLRGDKESEQRHREMIQAETIKQIIRESFSIDRHTQIYFPPTAKNSLQQRKSRKSGYICRLIPYNSTFSILNGRQRVICKSSATL